MIKKLRVAVDHGNRNMKTCNFVFTTGLTEQDKKPARGEKYLKYQGKYYTLSEKRIPCWQRRWRGQRKRTVDTFTDTSKPCCRTWDGLPARTHMTVTRAG